MSKLSVGKAIKIVRSIRDMSQVELAEASGISDGFLSMVERGEKMPTLGTLRKIAKALGVKMSTLFQLEEGNAEVLTTDNVIEGK